MVFNVCSIAAAGDGGPEGKESSEEFDVRQASTAAGIEYKISKGRVCVCVCVDKERTEFQNERLRRRLCYGGGSVRV